MATWMSCDLWENADAVFLITGMEENERFAKELVQTQMKVTPERFDGVFPIVYQKMLYTAPFEKFHGLRQLASQIRDATGLRACYCGIVGLDLTDWFGHEQEEYLKITFKFLHDHRQMWKILFTVGDADVSKIQRMMITAAPYLRLDCRELYLFRDQELLGNYLAGQSGLAPSICKPLAEKLIAIPAAHNCALIGQILTDISAKADKVNSATVRNYIHAPGNLLSILEASALPAARSCTHEKEKEV